jgi:hypothetical protein
MAASLPSFSSDETKAFIHDVGPKNAERKGLTNPNAISNFWEKTAHRMKEAGHPDRPKEQYREKLKNLLRQYKECKDSRGSTNSGGVVKNFRYESLMDLYFATDKAVDLRCLQNMGASGCSASEPTPKSIGLHLPTMVA